MGAIQRYDLEKRKRKESSLMRTDTAMLRTRPETRARVIKYIGERMAETGRRMSVDKAICELLDYYYLIKE